MTRDALEAKNSTGKFAGVFVETYRGYKVRIVRGREWGTLNVSIGGELLGIPYGNSNADALREAKIAHSYIDMSVERPSDFTWSRGPIEF